MNLVDPEGLQDREPDSPALTVWGIPMEERGKALSELLQDSGELPRQPTVDSISLGGDGRKVSDGPKSGNWCGKNWSGGQNPAQHGGKDGSLNPTSDLDTFCQQHDLCYGASNNPEDKGKCDKDLVGNLRRLDSDPSKWNNPPEPGSEGDANRMKGFATWWFK
ncbi:MAG: hypothetical protein AB7D57_04770 [Desulfovibrionaceae bacterium]